MNNSKKIYGVWMKTKKEREREKNKWGVKGERVFGDLEALSLSHQLDKQNNQ